MAVFNWHIIVSKRKNKRDHYFHHSVACDTHVQILLKMNVSNRSREESSHAFTFTFVMVLKLKT